MDPWPSSMYGVQVVNRDLKEDAGPLQGPISFILHTAESGSLDAVYGTFKANPAIASHGCAGVLDGKPCIYQFKGLDRIAGSLVGDLKNDPHAVQLETTTFSQTHAWKLDVLTAEATEAFMAYSADFHGIPLVRPNAAWKDDGSDITGIWASTSNSRRIWAGKGSRWPNVRGVWEHLEIPDNSHWDCGALNITDLIAGAKALRTGGTVSTSSDNHDTGRRMRAWNELRDLGLQDKYPAKGRAYVEGTDFTLDKNPDIFLGFHEKDLEIKARATGGGSIDIGALVAALVPALTPGLVTALQPVIHAELAKLSLTEGP